MVKDKSIIASLDQTIKLYNTEIHYIKKYFILPLYDTPGLLNRSKIVKLLLDVFSIVFIYSLLLFTGLINIFGGVVTWFTNGWGPVSDEQKIIALNYCLSTLGAIFLSEVLFQIFLNLTIKNKNFQVDKNKKYEIHAAVALIGLVLSCLNPALFYGFVGIFFAYMLFKVIKCIMVDKWNVESIAEKIGIGILFFYMLCQFFVGIVPLIKSLISSLAVLMGPLFGMFIVATCFSLIFILFILAINWQLFKQLGYEGWISLVPLYSSALFFKAIYGKWTKIFYLLIPFYNIYFVFKTNVLLAHKFKKSTGFGIGLTLLPIIFKPILVFRKHKK